MRAPEKQTRTMYCAKCQDTVTLTVTPEPLHGGHANLPDGGELVCLDFGPRCKRGKCAISKLPSAVMGVRLAESGLAPDQLDTVQARCDGCGRVSRLDIVDRTHARCPLCDTVQLWATLRLDGEEWVAVTGQRAEAELG